MRIVNESSSGKSGGNGAVMVWVVVKSKDVKLNLSRAISGPGRSSERQRKQKGRQRQRGVSRDGRVSQSPTRFSS